MASATTEQKKRLKATGIAGLDAILQGGIAPNRLYLVEGDPGVGKTTLAMQFLQEGLRKGETGLYITLSESREELEAGAASHGWSLEGIEVLEILASEESLRPDARYTMFHPSEVELSETTRKVLDKAARLKPARLVLDSLSELRLLAEDSLRYRRQVLALKQFFTKLGCTVIFIDDLTGGDEDRHLHSLAHGVISLERMAGDYGVARRRLQIAKLRGAAFSEGYHDFKIEHGGMAAYPRLVAAEHRGPEDFQSIPSGLPGLDALVGGGLAKGTSTLIVGAAGTGKSSIAMQYAVAAARRGQHASIFLFDESLRTFIERSRGLGMDPQPLFDSGHLQARQLDPAEMSPGEFAHMVRTQAGETRDSIVVIDSLNGYLNAMPDERFLNLHLHELLSYLGQQGVTTLLLMAQHGLVGQTMQTPVDASYLADTVLQMRYFESVGEIRKAISVIKKRTGLHERTIREFRMEGGLSVGEPLRDFHGVFTGTPTYIGPALPPASNGFNSAPKVPAKA